MLRRNSRVFEFLKSVELKGSEVWQQQKSIPILSVQQFFHLACSLTNTLVDSETFITVLYLNSVSDLYP